MYREVR